MLHPVIADDYRRQRNRKGMAAMAGLFVVDGIVTLLMHEMETRR